MLPSIDPSEEELALLQTLNFYFLSSCSGKSFIAISPSSLNSGKSITDSNLNAAGESLCGACNRYNVAT